MHIPFEHTFGQGALSTHTPLALQVSGALLALHCCVLGTQVPEHANNAFFYKAPPVIQESQREISGLMGQQRQGIAVSGNNVQVLNNDCGAVLPVHRTLNRIILKHYYVVE